MEQNIRLGFACKIIGEGDDINIRSLIQRRLSAENLKAIVAYNIDVLYKQFDFLAKEKFNVFRICSDVIPFGSSLEIPFSWEKEFSSILARLGQFAKDRNLRLSMHPGQYTVLNSLTPAVANAAIRDLSYHAAVLDCMEMDSSCKLVLHIGGAYGNKEDAISRFIKNYKALPQNIKNRLILENDDNRFNATDVLKICNECGCPMVLDIFHEQIYPSSLPIQEIILKVKQTWQQKDGFMKVHYSQKGQGKNHGAHSESIEREGFTKILPLFRSLKVDIMLEVKDKNKSAKNCQQWLKEWQQTQK